MQTAAQAYSRPCQQRALMPPFETFHHHTRTCGPGRMAKPRAVVTRRNGKSPTISWRNCSGNVANHTVCFCCKPCFSMLLAQMALVKGSHRKGYSLAVESPAQSADISPCAQDPAVKHGPTAPRVRPRAVRNSVSSNVFARRMPSQQTY